MATATTNEVDDIRRRMAQIRQRLHQDMQGVVAGAEAASDWKHYVRLYPWASLAACFAAGFLIVPRKRRSVTRTAQKAAEAAVAKVTEVAEANGTGKIAAKASSSAEEAKKKGWIGALIGLASPLVVRAAQSYALGYVETWIAQQQAAASGPTGAVPPGGPGRGGPQGRP